jgi:hypothetical protein
MTTERERDCENYFTDPTTPSAVNMTTEREREREREMTVNTPTDDAVFRDMMAERDREKQRNVTLTVKIITPT